MVPLIIFAALWSFALSTAPAVQLLGTDGRNFHRLAVANSDMIFGATADGRLSCMRLSKDAAGRSALDILWDADLQGSFTFSLTVADVDDDGSLEVLVGGADGFVRAFRASDGTALFATSLQHAVYAIAVVAQPASGALNGSKVFAGTANGTLAWLHGLSGEIQGVWQYEQSAIRTLVAGRFGSKYEMDGQQLFVVHATSDSDIFYQALRLEAKTSRRRTVQVTQRVFELEPLSGMWKNPQRSSWNGHAMGIGVNAVIVPDEVDDEILDTIVSNAGLFQPAVMTQSVAHLGKVFPPLSYADAYCMAIPAVGNFLGNGKRQAVTVYGMDVGLYELEDAHGGNFVSPVSRARTQLSFSDAVTLRSSDGADQLLLGSAPNGDDTLYLVSPESSTWSSELQEASWAAGGIIDSINRDVDEIGAAASSSATRALPAGTAPVTINVEAYLKVGLEDEVASTLAQLLERHSYYSSQFAYKQIRFAVEFAFYENFSYWIRPDGEPWERANAKSDGLPRSTLLDGLVRPLEAAGVSFIIRSGNASGPYISPETAAAVAEAAPRTLVGFSTAEQHGESEGTNYYLQHAVVPIMDVCLNAGCKVFMNEKNTFWASAAASDSSTGAIVLKPLYADVIVPSAEDSNSRSPDLDLAARVGLLASGTVKNLKARLVADSFAFNRLWDWSEVLVGHPHLRALAVQIALGANFIDLDCDQRWIDAGTDGSVKPQSNGVLEHGVKQLLHLIGRGVLVPPQPGALLLPPTALMTADVSGRFAKTGTGGHDYRTESWDADDLAGRFVLGRLNNMWGQVNTPDNDATRVLWGRERQFGNFIPSTAWSGGLVPVYPGVIGTSTCSQLVGGCFITDADTLHLPDGSAAVVDDVRVAAAAAAATVLPLGITAERPLFVQQIRLDDDTLLLYLISTGYTMPSDGQEVIVSLANAGVAAGGEWQVVDRVFETSLGMLGASGNSLSVFVGRGVFRVLTLTRQERNLAV